MQIKSRLNQLLLIQPTNHIWLVFKQDIDLMKVNANKTSKFDILSITPR